MQSSAKLTPNSIPKISNSHRIIQEANIIIKQ